MRKNTWLQVSLACNPYPGRPYRRSHCPNTMIWRPKFNHFTLTRPFSSTSIWRLSSLVENFKVWNFIQHSHNFWKWKGIYGIPLTYITPLLWKKGLTGLRKLKGLKNIVLHLSCLISTWIRRTKPWSSLSREGTVFVLVLFPEEPVAKLLDWLVAEEVGFLDLLIFAHATISRHCQ